MEKVLHYLYDPLCGWCYAAEVLAEAASHEFEVKLHAGGLFEKTRLSETKRTHIRFADAHIGELTGQVFSEAYLNGLLDDPQTIYDSAPPIRGVLAADAIQPSSGLLMLKALQRAHYRQGLRIVETSTICQIAEFIGLNTSQFTLAFNNITDDVLAKHLKNTHTLMRAVGVRGYPAFIAQIGQHVELLPHERFYGNADGFAKLVAGTLRRKTATTYAE